MIFRSVMIALLLIALSCNTKDKSYNMVTEKVSQYATPDELYPQLFRDVQLRKIFPDNKTFVDCTAKIDADSINIAYGKLDNPSQKALEAFVSDHFTIPPSVSSDFKSDMSRTPEEHIKALWPVLRREADKATNGSTLIALPKPYIVPGGRFREVYYWDSFFTMLGLEVSGEYELMENILDNFAYLISTMGHIPNGNRVYYKTRSQPPFFFEMVKLAAKKKPELLVKYKDALLKEYEFWMNDNGEGTFEHIVQTKQGIMNRYYDKGDTPRQESYREDFELVEKYSGAKKMYKDLRSGAESGWDYSSRWFSDGKSLGTIETTDIIPLDLNALLYGMESLLITILDDNTIIEQLKKSQDNRKSFLRTTCLATDGTYEDYNFVRGQKTGIKSLAMMYPLYFKMVSQEDANGVADFIKKKFLKPGGVISTLNHTGQQWDAPNGWAPLQWMTVVGLSNYGHEELAKEIATRWVTLNESVYQSTGKFVEKYNVEDISLEAGGGEYPVQDGFGWSNGVYLAMKSYLKTDN